VKSAQICREGLRGYKEGVEVVCCDPSRFVRPEGYDYVLANLPLRWLGKDREKKAFCRNAYRSLRPGGVFAFSSAFIYDCRESNKRIWKGWERDALENGATSQEIRAWHKYYFPAGSRVSPARWLGWLDGAGFIRCELVWCEHIFGTFRAAKK
jgi:SAM-dependent methyltransferase